MPRMIDDELYYKIVDCIYPYLNEDDMDALRSAPSVELLDLGKVESWIVYVNGDGTLEREKVQEGDWVRFSDLQSLVVPSRWIPMSERSPDKDEYCLVCDADSVWESQWFGYWFDALDLTPTHWQPLPLPPKEKP